MLRGYVTAFTTSAGLVIVAERAPGTGKVEPHEALPVIRDAVLARHGLPVADVRLVPAGAIPRTTRGKLARQACRAEYLGAGSQAFTD